VIGLCLLAAAANCSGGDEAEEVSVDAEAADAGLNGRSIERLIAFSSSADCKLNETFETLLSEMAPMDGIGRPAEPFDPHITLPTGTVVGRPRLTSEGNSHEVILPVDSNWHGLRLKSVTRWWTEESDHQGFTLTFRDDTGQVITALNRLGFDLAADGTRTVEGEVSTFLVVHDEGPNSAFTCYTG